MERPPDVPMDLKLLFLWRSRINTLELRLGNTTREVRKAVTYVITVPVEFLIPGIVLCLG
jgi:hypothetical protein